MMGRFEAVLRKYENLNSIAQENGAVLFGANCFAGLPSGELAQSMELDRKIYNRSIEGLGIEEAAEVLDTCVCALGPEKVMVNLGDADLERADFNLQAFLNAYEWLLYTLHNRCRARIYVASVFSGHPMTARVNEGLKRIARDANCIYIDIGAAAAGARPEIRIFELIKYHLRSFPVTFGEAFARKII